MSEERLRKDINRLKRLTNGCIPEFHQDIENVLDRLEQLEQENQQLKDKLNCDLEWALKYDELYKENQQLKEEISEWKINYAKLQTKVIECNEDRVRLNNVLDEIRECTKKYCSGIFTDEGEIVFVTPTANIVQILDKVKE